MSNGVRGTLLAGALLGMGAIASIAAPPPRQSAIRNPKSGNPQSAIPNPAIRNPQSAIRNPKSGNPQSAIRNPQSPAEQFYTQSVAPILKENCLTCHSGEKPQGGLDLARREGLLKGGESGPAVSSGRPEASLLLSAVNYRGKRMPPRGKLPQKQIDVLTRWVKMGAPWSKSAEAPKAHVGPPQVTPETKKFWSFQPVRPLRVPTVREKSWVRSPIDAFILRRLEDAGLAPNPAADRATLIRRASYDLTGLPPAPAEVEAFVADKSPDAWEKVVDRLLASPRYGEKWGRHWLDLVRYAESNSYERDGAKPNAWRYRDYVIRSFNEDKPYDQFAIEQLAGDELAPRTPDRMIATGYYRMGIWDDEPADPQQALYDDLDDIASTTGQVFLGLTVGCARCHDHKLDPIPIKDYYSFLSFFGGVRRYGVRSDESVAAASLRSIAPEADQQRQNALVAAHQEKVKANRDEAAAIEAKVLADLTPVEKEEWQTEPRRVPILSKRVPQLITAAELERYRALAEQRRALFRSQPRGLDMALCVTEIGPAAREMHILLRGSPKVPGERVEPAFLSILSPPAPQIAPSPHGDTSGRRLALARWIASAENPIASRVMANRVWQYHFGRGIVRSTNNFGLQGDRPTHPELLDWLAGELVAGGWRLKPLHRAIMLSAAYRMSSRGAAKALSADPENNLFWRFDMRRLQAEEIRDSILAINGSLNPKMGGPSIYPDVPAEVLAGQSMPGAGWGKSSPEEQRRRSVYIFVKRSLVMPIIASFDGPETDFTCPTRFATTQPTQALGMLNSDWINEQARVFAGYLRREAGPSVPAQVRLALDRSLQRPATASEVQRGVRLIERLAKEQHADPLAAFCVVALNLNEFVYVD